MLDLMLITIDSKFKLFIHQHEYEYYRKMLIQDFQEW